jgi:hypothetical protein
MKFMIMIRGEWLSCDFDFQALDVRVGAGAIPQTLICPRLSAACPELFCSKNCEGRGVCNFGLDGTMIPQCEPFPATDPPISVTNAPVESPSQSPTTTSVPNESLAPSELGGEDSSAYRFGDIGCMMFSGAFLLVIMLH